MNRMGFLQNIFSSKKKIIGLLVLLVIVLAVPLTVFIAQREQEIRQRAAGEQVEVYFAKDNDSPVTTVSLTKNTPVTFKLYLKTNSLIVNGYDIIVAYSPVDTLTSVTPGLEAGADANKFNSSIFLNPLGNGSFRIARVSTADISNYNQPLHLASFTFNPVANGTGSISVTKAEITSPTQTTFLSAAKGILNYTVSSSSAVTTWNVTAQPVCANGQTPTGNIRVFYALWPGYPVSSALNWQYDSFSTGNHSVAITANSPADYAGQNIYVGMETEAEVALQPIGNKPHSSIEYLQAFNPLTWMARWVRNAVPGGTYTIQYQAPDNFCVPISPTVSCNESEVTLSADPSTVVAGTSINFKISGDASTYTDDSFGTAAINCSGNWAGGSGYNCLANIPTGQYTWTHKWKHCVDNACSNECSKSINYTVSTGTLSCTGVQHCTNDTETMLETCGNCNASAGGCAPGFVCSRAGFSCKTYPNEVIAGDNKYPIDCSLLSNNDCKEYYWFDNDHRTCGKKQFCGTFMYEGLKTFETLDACSSALGGETTTSKVSLDLVLSGIGRGLGENPGNPTTDPEFQRFNCIYDTSKKCDYPGPKTPTRNVKLEIYSPSNEIIATKSGSIVFDMTTNSFKGNVSLGTLNPGTYTFKVLTDKYLKKLIAGAYTVDATTTTIQSPKATLVLGDINGDNIINLQDYGLLYSCVNEEVKGSCTLTDLNDDGVNDAALRPGHVVKDKLSDYQLLMKSYSNQKGD